MLKKLAVAVPFLLLAFPGASLADTYIGIGHHWGDYKNENEVKSDPTGLKLTIGKYLLPVIAIEAHFLKGIGSDAIKVSGLDNGSQMELDRAESLFLRGDLPLAERVNLYGLAGYSTGRLDAAGGGYDVTDKADGVSYGVGLEIVGQNNSYISAEYIQYLDESDNGVDFEYKGVNVNLGMRF
ncbi:porin family protein [Thiohalophilus thiocyanatoxydans]|uniref:Opacity protein-like surface antigen n=1 Tax=Thiohalophilus thiocyanatoxydans TaxID=381308 RepID=A0A4R8INH6_9GAMM|nr:porin family protein [Thiohalophilus thiocyanatoxydans]TDY02431.1 opacity protein-like surface antigen [Thiohalophilus thiocyanatoxydans]